jgi:DNA-binding MarR family transcriptional regulator
VNLSEAPTARMRSFELCESAQWEKSRLSHHLKRIKQRGLVNREPTKNARLPAFMLTEVGQAAITDAALAHASNVHAWFIDAIGPERLTLFTQDCGAACAALDKHEETEARKLAGCDADVPQIPFDRQHTMTARNVL